MGENSKIEWTDATWNPIAGCAPVSPGCAHCYAVTMTRRLEAMGNKDYAGLTTAKHFNGKIRLLKDRLEQPLRRKKPTIYFVNSMSDLFHEDVPVGFLTDVFAVMGEAYWHTFQVLTKRIERARVFLNGVTKPLPNVWIGTSVENQARKYRIDQLRKIPAVLRFLSLEPLLENIGELDLRGIGWVIVGGESGPHARPCNIEWIRDIVQQCKAAAMPVFVKQDSGQWPGQQGCIPNELWIKEFPR